MILDLLTSNDSLSAVWRFHQLTTGDALFTALKEAVWSNASTSAQWQAFQQGASLFGARIGMDVTKEALVILKRLLMCAQAAWRHRTEEFPASWGSYSDWDKGCILTFLEPADTSNIRRVKVPVTLVDKTNDSGFLATLSLEVIPIGVGAAYQHAADAFRCWPDSEFKESMTNAWKLALGGLRLPGEQKIDGRWRLTKGWLATSATEDIGPVKGGSASGAAARGWAGALTGESLDPRVCLVMKVDKNGQFGKVDGTDMGRKVQALVAESNIDTVVVNHDNCDDVRQALNVEKAGKWTEEAGSDYTIFRWK